MTLADVAAIKVKATKHHNEIKRMNALKSKAKSRKASDEVRGLREHGIAHFIGSCTDARRRKSRGCLTTAYF